MKRARTQRRDDATLSFLDVLGDEQLFAGHFRDEESWRAWKTFAAVLFGLPLDAKQRQLFKQCTGRDAPQPEGYREAWLVVGRRGGKSFMLATIAVYLACFRDWRPFLNVGERGTIMIVAADRKQARVILRYVKGLLQSVAMLARLIESETAESVTLSNRVTLEVHTASFRTVRGFTIVAALLDEIAFWPTDDAAEPDAEIINAIKPAMATIPGAMLLCASSPYARRGELWTAHRKHFGKDSSVLVWQAATRTMNPSVPQSLIDAALDDDAPAAGAEYLAQFRSDIEAFVAREVVEACISSDVFERPPQYGVSYTAFVDPSGGSADSMTLAIGHRERDIVIIDALRERRPPFTPSAVVAEFSGLLRDYRIGKVIGDRYAGEWPREQFMKCGIGYEPSAAPKSALYTGLLPILNSKLADLLDNERLIHQLVSLERRTARGGRDSIDHAPGAHDDLANAVAGLCGQFTLSKSSYNTNLAAWVGDPEQIPFCAPRPGWGFLN